MRKGGRQEQYEISAQCLGPYHDLMNGLRTAPSGSGGVSSIPTAVKKVGLGDDLQISVLINR
jgi:hypothetical protein